MANKREPIRIIKPYKMARQKNESPTDAEEAVTFLSNIVNSVGISDARIVSNRIETDTDIIDNPKEIVNQMLDVQNSSFDDSELNGKRVYSMIYTFPKEYGVDANEVADMVGVLLNKYPEFQSVAVVNKTEANDICCGIVFNNYSIDGLCKMTKQYRPYHMSNIYNRYIHARDR